MIIEETDETNFEQKNKEGSERVENKIKHLEVQLQKNTINWNLFYDPTIWAYKVLKDKQDKSLIMRGYQDKIINDKHQFVVTVAANQIGKTWTACIKAIHHALHVKNASVMIISKSEPQAIMILDEIKWMMLRANIKFDTVKGEVENRTELHLLNDDKKGVSVIRCLPPTTGALAYPATLIIPDEIGFWDLDKMDQTTYFEQVIMSRIQETQEWKDNCICGVHDCGHFTMGQIFAISNPNAQQGALWYLWKNPDFNQYRVCWLAKQGRTLEQYLHLKKVKPTAIFDSVYAAVFSSASGGFITEEEWKDAIRDFRLEPPITISSYLGGDFAGEDTKGRDVDQAFLVWAVPHQEEKRDFIKIPYYVEFPIRTKKEIIYDEIKKYPNIAKFAYDKVGVGDSVKNDLKERNIFSDYQIEALTYSLPNKSEVYYNLKHLFEQRKIIVPNNSKLKEQLLGLRFERTEGGYIKKEGVSLPLIKIHHATEGLHDDFADALANACYAARILKGVPASLTIVSKEIIKETAKKGVLAYCYECNEYFRGEKCPHFEQESLFI